MERSYHDYQENREEKETLKKLADGLDSIRYELLDSLNRNRYLEKIALSGILLPWLMIVPLALLPAHKSAVMLLIPICILAIAGGFIRWSIRRAKQKYQKFIGDSTTAIRARAFRESCSRCGFTKREIEIIEWQREGLTNTKIGEKLFISPATVRKHVENIYIKANVHSRTELFYEMEFKYIK